MPEETLRLTVGSLLDEGAEQCQRCRNDLREILAAQGGVNDASWSDEPSTELLLRVDSRERDPKNLAAFARHAGATLSRRFGHLPLRVDLDDEGSRRIAVRHLRDIRGVLHAELQPNGVGLAEFDREKVAPAELAARIADVVGPGQTSPKPGESARPHTPEASHFMADSKSGDDELRDHSHSHGANGDHDHSHGKGEKGHGHSHGGIFGERTELAFSVLCGLSLLAGWVLERLGVGPASFPLYLVAYGFGGWFTLREAMENLRKRRFEIDTLMLVAAAGAGALGEWAEGALLLFLFSLGHALEHFAMGRARRAIEALAELAPETALIRLGERTEEVPVEALKVGDVVLVRPNERLPADGVVVNGESSVDQSPVTGESVPVDKRAAPADDLDFGRAPAEHRVFAGTINGAGALDVRVARRASETTLARVVKMVAEAEAQRSPTQRFTDRFARIFVPTVLGFVGLLMLAFLVRDEPFTVSFYRAMAVLVAASPCALAISVPSAVLSGVARAGRGGVLVKGGGPLENLGTLTELAFDKTGTLTEGRPRLTDIVPANGVDETELLGVAVAVEALSDHPLAAAVVRDGTPRLEGSQRLAADAVESLTGQGILAKVEGDPVIIGKPKLFEGLSPAIPDAVWADADHLERTGRTVMIVRRGGRDLGVLGLMDTPRAAARDVIARLRDLGIRRIIMLSGDNQRVADSIAQKLGLDEAKGGLMPEDKVAIIQQLRERDGKVAMVGDGVNDAPAMANATVGIAMGAAGSDVALETADVALMADDLRHLPFAVGLSRRTSAVIRQNLWISLGMVAFLIPATLLGLKIGAAVLFHEGSTLVVVVNALRLLGYQEKTA